MRVLLTIEYDGTNYAGWQRQKNAMTVQEMVEDAIARSTGVKTAIVGAGRTDAGVHALGQVAHFDIETNIPADKLSYVINLVLPDDIRIRESRRVRDDFHARRDSVGKHYRYHIYNDAHAAAVNRFTCTHVRQELDTEAMRAGAQYFQGRHDFSAFHAQGTDIIGTVRTIYGIKVTKIDRDIYIDVLGNGFLYNMVRIMAGTLIDVGKGRIPPSAVERILLSKKRELAGPTAPACGLTMMSVIYDNNAMVFKDKRRRPARDVWGEET